ncbi:MAG: transposase [Synergistaceae bacterium]|nr:transposase [Synergistaceae bacterium]
MGRILNAEIEYYIKNSEEGRAVGNTRNGDGKKNVMGKLGQLELITPRDRRSTFEPQIIPN